MSTLLPTLVLLLTLQPMQDGDCPPAAEVQKALAQACGYFGEKVATQGGYLWQYSEDLRLREGEVKASDTMVWVQPPGTPTVGQAFLNAYSITRKDQFLTLARNAAHALVNGQLQSGGWSYEIEFDPELRKRHAYRVDGGKGSRNTTTLDDNTTQAALRFLIQFDLATGMEDKKVHEAVEYSLQSLLKAQFPNGAWPQRFSQPLDAKDFPVLKASYPASWPREFLKQNYQNYYTFNDNTIADMIDTMVLAEKSYGGGKYRESATRAGDFILLAQMPQPQPAWAQQYNSQMHPAWARKFEPPSITGGESQNILRTLLFLFHATGEKRFLEPIPPALAYLKKSRLPEGGLARFYELQTNRPLYFTRQYELVYHDQDLPTHYGFKVDDRLERIEREYEQALESGPRPQVAVTKRSNKKIGLPNADLTRKVQQILKSLDEQGRWVEAGKMRSHEQPDKNRKIISTRTFVQNVNTLCDYLASSPDR